MNTGFNIKRLLELMNAEMAGYEKMRELLTREKEIGFFSDRDALMQMAEEKKDLVNDLKRMEEKRLRAVSDIVRERGIAVDTERPITATGLARYLDPLSARELIDQATQLKRVMEQVQAENNANADRFSLYLGLIQDSLNMLNDLVYGQPVYGDPGAGNRTSGYGNNRGTVICGNV